MPAYLSGPEAPGPSSTAPTPDDAVAEAMRWAERLVTHLDRHDGDTGDALVADLTALTERIKGALAYARVIMPAEPRQIVGLPGGGFMWVEARS